MRRRARLSALGIVFATGLGLPAAVHGDELAPLVLSLTNTGCPERVVLEEALARRGLAAVDGGARFRLQLAQVGGTLDLTLRDDDGEVLLARTIAADECGALADTIAMLVARRLEGIAWRAPAVAPPAVVPPPPAPPPPPPPPHAPPRARVPAARAGSSASAPGRPWALDVQAGALFATGFTGLGAVPGPEAALRLRSPDGFALRLSTGWLVHDGISVSTGQARIDRVPIALFGGVSLRRRSFELDLGPCAAIELLLVETRDIAVPGHDARTALRLGPGAAATIEVASHVVLVVHVAALGLLSGWRFSVTHRSDPTARTRFAAQGLALELGAALGFRLGP